MCLSLSFLRCRRRVTTILKKDNCLSLLHEPSGQSEVIPCACFQWGRNHACFNTEEGVVLFFPATLTQITFLPRPQGKLFFCFVLFFKSSTILALAWVICKTDFWNWDEARHFTRVLMAPCPLMETGNVQSDSAWDTCSHNNSLSKEPLKGGQI